MSSNTTIVPNSATTSSPGLPTDRCALGEGPSIPRKVLNYTAGTGYCQFNFPYYLRNLSRCCDENEVHVWNNCTHFCQTNRDVRAWGNCIESTLPDFPGVIPGYGCGNATATGQAGRSSVGWMGMVVVGLAVLASTGV
ncbi:hypothetical protein W97_05166 [Coniosporium apollinis CBS 100218]|uniref:Uncharacterized protein n=1 Tax=Coniosporium apollinis (strain CBS 100218) TaxID=1168221 RepID=R7YVT4_CONA1|nr:uncharacterized protein W97_05166 [Coniosporium apollinis CBS 100218]EON65924.1 hypothetical protein W97_05166 [Coniosporium apollinis CBS 100218]